MFEIARSLSYLAYNLYQTTASAYRQASHVNAQNNAFRVMQDHLQQECDREYGKEFVKNYPDHFKRKFCEIPAWILNFRKIDGLSDASLRYVCMLINERKTRMHKIFDQLKDEITYENLGISDTEGDDLFLNGICSGLTFSYFKQLHTTRNVYQSFPFPLKLLNRERNDGGNGLVIDYSKINIAELEKKTQQARFLQVAGQLDSRLSPKQPLAYMCNQVMKNQGFEVTKVFQSNGSIIEDLIPTLKTVISQQSPNGYQVLIINMNHDVDQIHTMGLYLRKPFYFIDCKYGVFYSNAVEKLVFLLSTFLEIKYKDYDRFAIFEFVFSSSSSDTKFS